MKKKDKKENNKNRFLHLHVHVSIQNRIQYNFLYTMMSHKLFTKSVPQTETSYSEVENVSEQECSNSASSHIIHILQSYKLCSHSVRSGINSEM